MFFLFLPVLIIAQLQSGDEHWKQFTQIKEGKYVSSIAHSGSVYACFQGETPTTSNSYTIYQISENDVKVYSQITLSGDIYGPGAQITSMTFFNNELIVAGVFQRVNDNLAKGCARWDGENWRSLGLGIEGLVLSCVSSEKEVFFYGIFDKAGGQPARSFVKWDGSRWSILANINCDQVKIDYKKPIYNDWYNIGRLTFFDNYIYAVGWIVHPIQGYDYVSKCKDSKFFTGLVRYVISENRWEQVFPFQRPSREIPKIYGISAFLVVDKSVYMAGIFGTTKEISIKKFEDNKWTSLGNIQEQGTVESIVFVNDALYIGGTFSGITNTVAHNIAKWDGTKWNSLGSGLSGGIKGEVQVVTKPKHPDVLEFPQTDVVKCLYNINNSILTLGNFNKAGAISSKYIADWNESVSIEKPNSDSLYKIAEENFYNSNGASALEEINQAIEMNPNKPECYLLRGRIYSSKLEKYDGSNVRDLGAEIQSMIREYMNKAENDFNTAIKLKPNWVEAYIQRGYLGYLALSNPYPSKINAEEDLEMASQLDSGNPFAYYCLGLYYRKENSEKAVRNFQDAIKYSKTQFITDLSNFYLAEYYFHNGSFQESINYINEFLKNGTQENWYWARRYRGMSKYNLNDFDGALKDFNDILSKFPNDKAVADIYRFKARILFKKSGNFKDACPDMKKSSNLGDEEATKFMEEVCK
jgi:tetratricopeptide (TPR) repeat protein